MDFNHTMSVLLLYLNVVCALVMCQGPPHNMFMAGTIKHAQQKNTELIFSNQPIFSPLEQTFIRENMNDVIEGAETILSKGFGVEPSFDVSETCLNHTELLLGALINGELWALRMVDAMGKPTSGLLDGQLTWLGAYDECIDVQATINNSLSTHPFTGQYCRVSFPINEINAFGASGSLTIGMCFPSSCSQTDARGLAATLASLVPGVNVTTLPPPNVTCQKNTLKWDTKAAVVIVVCSTFLLVIALATAYDIVIVHWWSGKYANRKHLLHISSQYNRRMQQSDETTHLLGNSDRPEVRDNAVPRGKPDVENTGHVLLDGHSTEASYQPGKPGKALLAFSVYTNASKILDTTQHSGSLTAVNGIRFISMTWVILGHTYVLGLQYVENLPVYVPKLLRRITFQAIDNASVSVDTFFVLSGLLVAFLSLKEMKKRGGVFKFNWGVYYFHRFWRLTPPYMLWMMVYVTTVKYWSNIHCGVKQAWKTSTNAETPGGRIFCISTISMNQRSSSLIWGSVSCLAFILINFITSGTIASDLSAADDVGGFGKGESFYSLYIKPWCRIGPYVVGIYTGYLLYRTDCKVKMSKIVTVLGWLFASAMAFLTLYGLYSSDGKLALSVEVYALYTATARTAWGMSVAWVVYACATGYGGPVNAFLSWPAMIPLSRLTYCAYLVHPVVLYVYYMSRHTLMYWYDLEMIYLFLGHLCVAYALAFVVSLAFESPMMGLEKVLLGRGKKN